VYFLKVGNQTERDKINKLIKRGSLAWLVARMSVVTVEQGKSFVDLLGKTFVGADANREVF
jgi:hypothetical protein